MSIPWKRALALALAASLVASPALARGRHDRNRHHGKHGKHHGHAARSYQPAWYGGHGHRAYQPTYGYYGGHRHHHHGDADDVALALGIAAVGISAVALWAAAQPSAPSWPGPVAAPAPEPIEWDDPDSGVTVLSEGNLDTGEYCREFQKEITVGGRVERGYGIACLMEDGSWRIGR